MGVIDNIKRKFLNKKINSSEEVREIIIQPIEKYRNIIVVSNSSDHDLLIQLSKLFQSAKISILYIRKEKEDKSKTNEYTVHIKDFAMNALKNEKLKNLVKEKFDLLIDMSDNKTELNFIVKNIQSTLKIGKYNSPKSYLYDLLIEFGSNTNDFTQNINKHLNIFSQK